MEIVNHLTSSVSQSSRGTTDMMNTCFHRRKMGIMNLWSKLVIKLKYLTPLLLKSILGLRLVSLILIYKEHDVDPKLKLRLRSE